MLQEFTRNFENFKNLSKKIKVFRTSDLYNEFVNLGDYFNNVLKIELEKILNISLINVPDKFLINVGNGNVDWVNIVDVIEDNTIPLSKLEKIPLKSVLCSDEYGNIIPITCNIEYGILFARYQNTHVWRKLVNEDIMEQSLTGEQIDILEQINLDDNITNNFITYDLLETDHIIDKSIDSSKIIDGTLDFYNLTKVNDENNIGFIPDKYVNDVGVDNITAFRVGFLPPEKIMDNSIDPNKAPNLFFLTEYSDNLYYLFNNINVGYEFPVNYNLNAEVLENFNILPECLEDAHLIPYVDIGNWQNIPWYDNYLEPRYFQQGYIAPRDDCRIEGRCIPAGQLRLRHFDDEVRAALIAKGVTDDD